MTPLFPSVIRTDQFAGGNITFQRFPPFSWGEKCSRGELVFSGCCEFKHIVTRLQSWEWNWHLLVVLSDASCWLGLANWLTFLNESIKMKTYHLNHFDFNTLLMPQWIITHWRSLTPLLHGWWLLNLTYRPFGTHTYQNTTDVAESSCSRKPVGTDKLMTTHFRLLLERTTKNCFKSTRGTDISTQPWVVSFWRHCQRLKTEVCPFIRWWFD